MEETLDLRKFFDILKKRILLISLLVIIAIALSVAISNYLLTPVYESSTQILVNQEVTAAGNVVTNNVETDLQLINTYSVIINSPVILEQVIDTLNLDMTLDEMKKKITVTSASDSQVMDISVRNENQETGVEIVNTIATVFEEEIQEVMNVNNVTILSTATVRENQNPVSPNLWVNVTAAVAIGLLLGVGAAFLLDYLDTSVKNQKDVKKLLDVPVLAVISPIERDNVQTKQSKIALEEKEA